jgi:hypothetical protein
MFSLISFMLVTGVIGALAVRYGVDTRRDERNLF